MIARRSAVNGPHAAQASPAPATHSLPTGLRIGPANDLLEREADRAADAVVSNQTRVGALSATSGGLQRKCAECEAEEHDTIRLQREDEEDEEILTKSESSAGTARSEAAATSAGDAVGSGGVPLSSAARSYFEPRFGHDFSDVRIHTHGRAQAASRTIGARAYTLGRDIAFAPGEFEPRTRQGRHLLAHELAHVVQQNRAPSPVIRRARYGKINPPSFASLTLAAVPPEEREHVDAAMQRVDEIVNDPEGFSACHDNFADQCPNGNDGTLRTVWGRAAIWRITSSDPDAYARAYPGGSDIAYTDAGYGQGVDALAQTLLHESGHLCGITGGDDHRDADRIAAYCMGGGANEFTVSFGANLGTETGIMLVSYRRFLADWASGRIRLTAGADVDLFGVAFEAESEVLDKPGSRRPTAEFGSGVVGGQFRLGGFGGSRFGGFNARVETGFGAGRFSLRPSADDEGRGTMIAPSWVLQVGPRAEFTIPMIGAPGRVVPVSIGAAYRLVQPLNSEAEALHGFMGSAEFRF